MLTIVHCDGKLKVIYVRRKQVMKKTILTIVLVVLAFGSLSAQAA